MTIQQTSGPRGLRIWRMALKGSLIMSLFLGVGVYAARLPDNYACVQLIDGSFSSGMRFDLVDLNSGTDMLDSRVSRAPFGLPSPDGRLMAALQATEPGSTQTDLVITGMADQPEKTETVVIQKNVTSATAYRFRNMRWSPDSARLAFLWVGPDDQLQLSVVSADGSDKQTTLMPDVNAASRTQYSTSYSLSSRQIMINWSADHAYLSTEEDSSGAGSVHTLWSAADLSQIELEGRIVLRSGAWSPAGHRFAGIGEGLDGSQRLVIFSPEIASPITISLTPDRIPYQVLWSPNSQYVALQSHRDCESWEACSGRWSFDVFGSDGRALARDLEGASWDSSIGQPEGETAVSVWSPDGEAWIFLQETRAGTTKDLVALHVADNRYETIASNVVGELTEEMLYTPSPYRRFWLPNPLTDRRIVLPTWRDGKITVELADVDGNNRTILAGGADEILEPRSMYFGSSNQFWSFNGDLVVVLWTSGGENQSGVARLTWSRIDGSDQHQIGDGLDGIDYLQLVTGNDQQWLGYIARRGATYSVEIAEVSSGKHYRLLDGLAEVSQWFLAASPDGTMAALQLGASAGRYYGESTLYLVTLDGSKLHEVSAEVVGRAQWSPDGSKVAFLHLDSSKPYLSVVTANGDFVQNVAIRNTTSTQPRLYQWSRCT